MEYKLKKLQVFIDYGQTYLLHPVFRDSVMINIRLIRKGGLKKKKKKAGYKYKDRL